LPLPPLPTAADLPRRWSAIDADRVFAALDQSGLTITEFARRTGVHPKRLGRTNRARLAARFGLTPAADRADGDPIAPIRLVELVARSAAPTTVVAAPARTIGSAVHAISPGGWRLEVPGGLLAELVRALGVTPC
jgi:hypothetical protein